MKFLGINPQQEQTAHSQGHPVLVATWNTQTETCPPHTQACAHRSLASSMCLLQDVTRKVYFCSAISWSDISWSSSDHVFCRRFLLVRHPHPPGLLYAAAICCINLSSRRQRRQRVLHSAPRRSVEAMFVRCA